MNLKVGQIIYLLSSKDIKVYPALVVEEIKRRTIEEEIISHIVLLPDKDGTQMILENISAEVFIDLASLEKKMIQTAKEKISAILGNAKAVESKAFPDADLKGPGLQSSNPGNDNDIMVNNEPSIQRSSIDSYVDSNEKVEVDLGNGIKAKINVEELNKLQAGQWIDHYQNLK